MRRARWWCCVDRGSCLARVALAAAGAVLAAAPPPALATDLGDGLVRLRHETYPARVAGRLPVILESRHPVDSWIVAFDGPADEMVREEIAAADGRIVGYVASHAYVVRGSVASAQALQTSPFVLRIDAVRPAWRISPDLDRQGLRRESDSMLFVDVWRGEDVAAAADAVRATGVEILRVDDSPGLSRLLVRAGAESVEALSALSAVEWIEPMPVLTLRNDRVRWVIQSNDGVGRSTPLHDHGLFGQGEIIGHIDTSPNPLSCYFLDPVVSEPGPTHRKLVAFRSTASSENHGSHTAGTACGEHWDPGLPAHRGMAPKARLAHANSGALTGMDWNGTPSNLYTMLADAHADGARVHTNSWGDDRWTSYTDWCVDIDTFSWLQEEDLVLFAVTNTQTLRSPENAKNSLAVGATYPPALQDSISAGGRGPTIDGRRKPEVYAPGRDTISANIASCDEVGMTGTSMACPAVAGGATLVREYYRRGFYPTGRAWARNELIPSGALIKATVVNSAVDMARELLYPGLQEGWGRILLDNALYFEGDSGRLWLRDVRHAAGLSTADEREWSVTVRSSAEPLVATMAFMDAPGTRLASISVVNDLDLEIEGPDGLFRGNFFDNVAGVSLAGGIADPLNNVERVIVSFPTPGRWTVRVRGTSVPIGPQGFAVVLNGAVSGRRQDTNTLSGPSEPPDDPPTGPGEPMTGWRLDPVRPTPFRDAGDVFYSVAVRSAVSLRVYDVTGRLVRVLLDRVVNPGEHTASWDGRDDAGESVGPGIYLLRLTAPGFARTVRTVRLR